MTYLFSLYLLIFHRTRSVLLQGVTTNRPSDIAALEEEGCTSIAIIGKTMAECKRLNELLIKSGLIELSILTGNEESYTAGTLIVPAYAAKGLEFDTVLLVTIDEKYHHNELDAKLLYVARTRSLHQLYHFSL